MNTDRILRDILWYNLPLPVYQKIQQEPKVINALEFLHKHWYDIVMYTYKEPWRDYMEFRLTDKVDNPIFATQVTQREIIRRTINSRTFNLY